MGNRFNVSRQVISYQIYKKMNKKRVKKPKVDALTEAAISKRYRRSWSLYNLLKKDNWKSTLQVMKLCFICRIEMAKQDANT